MSFLKGLIFKDFIVGDTEKVHYVIDKFVEQTVNFNMHIKLI